MADDNESKYGPYKSEDEQFADLISNVINPNAATPAGPTPTPAPPAAAPKAPVAPVSAPAPAFKPGMAPGTQFWESVTPKKEPSPAGVTRSGDPSQPAQSGTWADLVKSGKVKLGQDQGELQRLQQTGPGVDQIGNKFLRGAAKVADTIGTAISPRIAAAVPGTTMHNRQLQAQAAGRIAQDEDVLKTATGGQDQEAQMQERGARAAKENAQAQAYTPVTLSAEQAAAIGHPELAGESLDQRAYSAMLTTVQKGKNSMDVANANNTTRKDIATGRNQTAENVANTRADAQRDVASTRANASEDVARIRHAGRVGTGGAAASSPQREAQRQAIIRDATAKVEKLNTWNFDEDANDGRGGFYDPSNPTKVYPPEEFTAMKNQIAGDLDKQLTAKKFNPLNVVFDVKSTTPGKGGAQPTQAQPAAKQQTAQFAVQDGGGKQLTDANLAKQYLAKAGGDKDKARQLAQKDNWKF